MCLCWAHLRRHRWPLKLHHHDVRVAVVLTLTHRQNRVRGKAPITLELKNAPGKKLQQVFPGF